MILLANRDPSRIKHATAFRRIMREGIQIPKAMR
jgi:hypothetical protein